MQYIVLTYKSELFGLGEKQSSSILTQVLSMRTVDVFMVFIKSVFLGMILPLFDNAVATTSVYLMFLELTMKLFQHGESLRWIPDTSRLVVFSA